MNRTEAIGGGCHCGATRFETDTPPEETFACDCGLCRKQGTVWACYAPERFRLQRPADDVGLYRGEGEALHHFCRGCGCATYVVKQGAYIWVNARLFDSVDMVRSPVHAL